jgi:hypothetical protein
MVTRRKKEFCEKLVLDCKKCSVRGWGRDSEAQPRRGLIPE